MILGYTDKGLKTDCWHAVKQSLFSVNQSDEEMVVISYLHVILPLTRVIFVVSDANCVAVSLSQSKVVGPRENGDTIGSPTESTPTQENPPF